MGADAFIQSAGYEEKTVLARSRRDAEITRTCNPTTGAPGEKDIDEDRRESGVKPPHSK